MTLGGDMEGEIYFRPSVTGISRGAFAHPVEGDDWVHDPTAGWSTVVDAKTNENLVFLMNYHDVDKIYNCIGRTTVEWMYDWVGIPAGKTWKTVYRIVPAGGFAKFSHASKNVLANNSMTEQGKAVEALPDLSGPFRSEARATGTDGKADDAARLALCLARKGAGRGNLVRPSAVNENPNADPTSDDPPEETRQKPHQESGWGGIRTPGGVAPTAVFKTAAESPKGMSTQGDAQSKVNDLADCLALLRRESPELAVVVATWSTLPKAVQAGILAMIEASAGEGGAHR